jgi:hypothetical protein
MGSLEPIASLKRAGECTSAILVPGPTFLLARGLIYYSNPPAQIQVLLPPLGSWKRRLLDEVGDRRHVFDQRAASCP